MRLSITITAIIKPTLCLSLYILPKIQLNSCMQGIVITY